MLSIVTIYSYRFTMTIILYFMLELVRA